MADATATSQRPSWGAPPEWLIWGMLPLLARLPIIAPLLGAALVIEAVGHMTGSIAGANETHFFKNLGMMGGLLMITVYGPGRWAVGRPSPSA